MQQKFSHTALQGAEIFLKAASYIRTYGWQVSGMGVHGAPRCSMGALESACPQEKWDNDMATLMYAELYDELDGVNLTQFNEITQDGEQVAQLFERVAKRLQKMTRNIHQTSLSM